MAKDNTKEENKYALKMTAMILITILGIVATIGAFWGREGYIYVGVGLMILCFFGIVAMPMTE